MNTTLNDKNKRANGYFKYPAKSHSKQLLPYRLAPLAAFVAGILSSVNSYAAGPEAAQPVIAAAVDKSAADQEPTDLGEVVVRSRNRIELLRDVPISESVVQGAELARLGATGINEITRRAGNVSWNQGNQRTSSLAIRGLGKVGQTEAQDPSVGVIVDGVNYGYNALTSSFDFTDIDTVEVARGPQGTLLGKNSSVGVINITTKRPSFTPSADYSLTFGQYDTFVGSLAAGGPIIDGLLAWRGAFSVSRGDGDIKNTYNNDITYTNRDRLSGRVQFLFTPTPDFSARVAVDLQPRAGETTNGRTINTPTPLSYANGTPTDLSTDSSTRLGRRWFTQSGNYGYTNGFLYGGNNGNEVNNDNQRALISGSHGVSAELNWDLHGYTLTSITAYKDYHFNSTNDDGTPFDIYRNAGGFLNDYKQTSQEFRFTSPVGGFVDYQTGLFFMSSRNDSDYRRAWGNDAGAWFANPTQYARLDADAAGRYLMQNSLDGVIADYNSPTGQQYIRNKNAAIFGQANWHFSDAFTVTTGLRVTREDRENSGRSSIASAGLAPELNPAQVNGVTLGGFDSTSSGALTNNNSRAQLTVADLVASKYFGIASSSIAGAAYNSLSAAQKAQVAAAKTIRQANIGVLFNQTTAEPFKKTQPALVISPSYKINKEQNAYLSLQYGEKAGISQLVNGVSALVKPEKNATLEAGLKSALLNNTLTLNADVFISQVKDYQQAVRIVDEYTTALNNNGQFAYTTATGNVSKVQVSGLEVDGLYTGLRNWSFRFAGAYNKAIYKDFKNSAQPVENAYSGASPYRDVSGQALAGAPKFSFNVGVDYRHALFGDKEFHSSANVAYTGRYNSDVSLSDYAWIPGSTVVDLAVGVGKQNRSFDVSLIVKNLFKDDAPQLKTWNTYTPATPRWVGLVFTGKL